ncbi:metal ABC transporter permease [Candidatus Gottesmanbacteria bacterium]|nr:metal ABC transporter permease [Candidatus Gottesmanbacteria bacterium]
MNTNFVLLLLVGAFVGAASGRLGSFMVLKRMSLVGDALSHVALPGIAVAITFGFHPMVGALLALLSAVLGIWYLGEHSEVYPEALVGVVFTASLAVGILLTPEPELFEALFGNIEKMVPVDALVVLAAASAIFMATRAISKKLLLSIVSDELATSGGVDMPKLNLIYLLLVGFVVALGVKFLGTLLTGALVIVPAAAAKNLAKNMQSYWRLSSLFGVISASAGILIAKFFTIPSGPAVVLVAVGLFLASYIFKERKKPSPGRP